MRIQSTSARLASGDPRNEPPVAIDSARDEHEAIHWYSRKIAHDLNNIASVIRSYSELLLGELPPHGTAHSDALEVLSATEMMVTYVHQVTQFSNVNADHRRPANPDTTIHTVVDSWASNPDARQRGITVRFDAGTDAPSTLLQLDAYTFASALSALVKNAVEAAPDHSTVVISRVQRSDSYADLPASDHAETRWLCVAVSDSGPGFDGRIQHTAEDPLVTTKAGVRGAGMGLAFARAFARAHDGRLVRERRDQQTIVSLWLPLS